MGVVGQFLPVARSCTVVARKDDLLLAGEQTSRSNKNKVVVWLEFAVVTFLGVIPWLVAGGR